MQDTEARSDGMVSLVLKRAERRVVCEHGFAASAKMTVIRPDDGDRSNVERVERIRYQ